MKVEIKGDVITITGKIGEDGGPFESTSKKSVILLGSAGTKVTDTLYKGHQVSVNLNVMIPNPNAPEDVKKKGPKTQVSV